MPYNDLLNHLSDIVVLEPSIQHSQKTSFSDGSAVLTIWGEGGMVDIEFETDGGIQAVLESQEQTHIWQILPNTADIQASVRKICNIISPS